MYKFGTRYYNPGFGRWSQQDPVRSQLKDPTSLNRYLYAGDDPVNFTDPSGRLTALCVGALAAFGIIGSLAFREFIVRLFGVIVGLMTFGAGATDAILAALAILGASWLIGVGILVILFALGFVIWQIWQVCKS